MSFYKTLRNVKQNFQYINNIALNICFNLDFWNIDLIVLKIVLLLPFANLSTKDKCNFSYIPRGAWPNLEIIASFNDKHSKLNPEYIESAMFKKNKKRIKIIMKETNSLITYRNNTFYEIVLPKPLGSEGKERFHLLNLIHFTLSSWKRTDNFPYETSTKCT